VSYKKHFENKFFYEKEEQNFFFRNRTCNNPFPQYGGVDCAGSIEEIVNCSQAICPIGELVSKNISS